MSAPPPDAAGLDAASAELEALGIGVVVRQTPFPTGNFPIPSPRRPTKPLEVGTS